MGRILETSDIENEREVSTSMISSNRREVAAPGLSHRGAIIRGDDNRLPTGRHCKRRAPSVKTRSAAAVDLDIGAVATRQVG